MIFTNQIRLYLTLYISLVALEAMLLGFFCFLKFFFFSFFFSKGHILSHTFYTIKIGALFGWLKHCTFQRQIAITHLCIIPRAGSGHIAHFSFFSFFSKRHILSDTFYTIEIGALFRWLRHYTFQRWIAITYLCIIPMAGSGLESAQSSLGLANFESGYGLDPKNQKLGLGLNIKPICLSGQIGVHWSTSLAQPKPKPEYNLTLSPSPIHVLLQIPHIIIHRMACKASQTLSTSAFHSPFHKWPSSNLSSGLKTLILTLASRGGSHDNEIMKEGKENAMVVMVEKSYPAANTLPGEEDPKPSPPPPPTLLSINSTRQTPLLFQKS